MAHTRTPYSEAADIKRALHGKIEFGLELVDVKPDTKAEQKDRFIVYLQSEKEYHGQRYVYSVQVHGAAAKTDPRKVAHVISADAAETMNLSLKLDEVEPPDKIQA